MYQIILPSMYADIPKSGKVCIEHAAVDCRIHETFLALAVSYSGTVVFIANSLDRTRFLLHDWFDWKPRRFGSYLQYKEGDLNLWVCKEFPSDLPLPVIAGTFILDAHTRGEIPNPATENIFVAGEMGDRGSTFYSYARRHSNLYQFPLEVVERHFTIQTLIDESSPSYKRKMDLVDEEITPTPFFRFARTRLRIKTDKPPEILSPRQKEAARKMAGDHWHSRAQAVVVPFELFRVQKRFFAKLRLIRKKGFNKILLLKYRRGGYTAGIQGWMYANCVEVPYTNVTTFAHNDKSTKRIFRIARDFNLHDEYAPENTSDSKIAMEFVNGSTYFIGTAGSKGMLRGDQVQIAHGSEVAKWCRGPNQIEMVDDTVAAVTGAASYGWTIFETTPDGREWFCLKYEEAKKGLNDWYPLFLRWFDDPNNFSLPGTYDPEEIQDTVSKEELQLNLTIPQIAFRRQKQKEYGRLFAQEMPEDDVTCFLTTGICLFDTDALLEMIRRLKTSTNGNVQRRSISGGIETRWANPIPGVEYVAGCDTSEGLPGCDLNGIGILRKDTGEQVCSIHGLFDTVALAENCVRICKEYNNALLGVERENHGHAVLQKIVDLGYGDSHYSGGRLFYHIPTKVSSRNRSSEARRERSQKIGWSTNGLTRPVMLDDLVTAVENGEMIVHDEDFLQECLTFRKQSNGKFSADPGAHDDSVMKWAIAWQMRYHRSRSRGLSVLEGTL